MTRIRTLALAISLLLPLASPAGAQEEPLQPLSDYMQRYISDPADTDALRYLAHRCGATMLTISALPENRVQPDLVEGYSVATTTFLHLAVVIDESYGIEPTHALAAAEQAIEALSARVKSRLDQNLASSGSYLTDDPLMKSDIEICMGLSEKLHTTIRATPSV